MKDKKKKGHSQGQEGQQSDESDDEEVIYFGFNNENKGKEQIIAITKQI